MVYVCKKHLIEGLRTIQVPHVNKVSSTKLFCRFCGDPAHYKLFTNKFISYKKQHII